MASISPSEVTPNTFVHNLLNKNCKNEKAKILKRKFINLQVEQTQIHFFTVAQVTLPIFSIYKFLTVNP